MNKKIIALIVTLLVTTVLIVFGAYSFLSNLDSTEENKTSSESSLVDTKGMNEPFRIADPETDFVREGVNATNIEFGCAGADCIPSIDDPVFETREQADTWLLPEDLVFTVKNEEENVFKAYPQRVLNWHEIVNDYVGREAVAVTFCPLCGSALGFNRTIDGVDVDFGVSGRLLNNNLIMYDRETGSLWQQETGEAIVGESAEKNLELEPYSVGTTTWQRWKEAHPTTQVLSRDTGFARDYDRYPYGTYEEDGRLLFGLEQSDQRLELKVPGFGFDIDGSYLFYTEESVNETGARNVESAAIDAQIITEEDGTVFIQLADGNKVFPLRTFWFAWAAFHPDTEIFSSQI